MTCTVARHQGDQEDLASSLFTVCRPDLFQVSVTLTEQLARPVAVTLPHVLRSSHQVKVLVNTVDVPMRNEASRLPGLCRRLKRRRITVLVKTHKNASGQVCRCPRGSRCSHFFVHSL
uniref:Uncharacterized protein n=1 Tax=Scophthalmus maximus TaxID=52904 RepID=A0A8D3AX18_SCOMX